MVGAIVMTAVALVTLLVMAIRWTRVAWLLRLWRMTRRGASARCTAEWDETIARLNALHEADFVLWERGS